MPLEINLQDMARSVINNNLQAPGRDSRMKIDKIEPERVRSILARIGLINGSISQKLAKIARSRTIIIKELQTIQTLANAIANELKDLGGR